MRRGNQVLYLMAATVNDNNHRPSFNCPLIIKAKCIGSMIFDDPPRHLVMLPPPPAWNSQNIRQMQRGPKIQVYPNECTTSINGAVSSRTIKMGSEL